MNEYDFTQAFLTSSERKEQFSYEGLKALYNYFEEYEEDTGEQIEFDMIAICCEYSEYCMSDLRGGAFDYQDHIAGAETDEKALEALQDYTQVIHVNDEFFIIADF